MIMMMIIKFLTPHHLQQQLLINIMQPKNQQNINRHLIDIDLNQEPHGDPREQQLSFLKKLKSSNDLLLSS